MRALLVTLSLLSLAVAAAADPVEDAAMEYAAYQADVGRIAGAAIARQDDLDDALARAAFEPESLAQSYVAFAAVAAAQSPAFAAGVRSRVRAAGRAAVLRQLQRDMGYARRRPPGAVEAVQYALTAMAGERTRLQTSAGVYERFVFADWPVLADDARDRRNDRLRSRSRRSRDETERIVFERPSARLRFRPHHAPAMDRALTLAALHLIDAASAERPFATRLMDDPPLRECLTMAQLQFRQCASVARGGDEDAACLARHGLRDVADCLAAPLAN